MRIEHKVPLAPLTTLQLGGEAARFAKVCTEDDLLDALQDASDRGDAVLVLGGGSNLVVPDEGWPGLAIQMAIRSLDHEATAGRVVLHLGAGEPWDETVAHCVAQGWMGVECLAGIPGCAGATPIQNVGAYGREVGEVLLDVRAWDREARAFVTMTREQCRLSYRHSIFKEQPHRWIITSIRLELREDSLAAPVKYAELARALEVEEGGRAPLKLVGETIVRLRRSKGMVVDAADPESVSAGSYFTNPILERDAWEALVQAVHARLGDQVSIPAWPSADATWKVPAAWLIERAGFAKGYCRGGVGISQKHALALVNRGGTTGELLALEAEIVERVRERFGVTLSREPVLARPAP
ncbi:MAG: UDP-N-acetylmuramate dehydrogenase [Deltaproteobacteria bacterium]|nr:UDP-N-acetylmuramate dehydrogenase [Deltaproteobacteria bacterium]